MDIQRCGDEKSICNASIQYLTLISIDSQTLLCVAPFFELCYESSVSYKLAKRREPPESAVAKCLAETSGVLDLLLFQGQTMKRIVQMKSKTSILLTLP